MPDSSFFPQWGQQSFDDRDLDSLLAGGGADIPPALRPVADSLSALRAAPSPRELTGEDDARALFRSHFQGTPFPAAPAQDGPVAGRQPQHTLVMPSVPRHRHRARARRRRPRRGVFASLAGVAAAAVVIGAAAYTGQLPGPVQQLAHDTIAAPSARHAPGGTAASVQARSASPVAPDRTQPATGAAMSGSAPASAGKQGRKQLCDDFWSDLEHPQPGTAPWRTPRYHQLINVAGGQRKVFGYCFPVWDPQYAPQYPTLPAYPPFFPKHWNSGQQDGGSQPDDGSDNGNAPGPSGDASQNDNGNAGTPASSDPSPSASAESSPGGNGPGAQQQHNGN